MPLNRIPRRSFLQAAGAASAGLALRPTGRVQARPPLDLLVRGGIIVDGTGRPGFPAAVGVREGRIVEVGALEGAEATLILEVAGLVVAPGFVDIHGHTDLGIFIDNRADSKVRQGVTTEVVGQDGSSVLPVSDRMREARRRDYAERHGIEVDFATWDDLFRALEGRGILTNWVTMVGSGTVREVVIGYDDRPPTEAELARMVALVEEARDAGAVGISSGLEYTPNAFADDAELVALAEPFATRALPYATHLRNEADHVQEAIAEALAIAEAAEVPLQLSHIKAQGRRNWGESVEILATIEQAASRSTSTPAPIRFDAYPYTAYSTGLSSLFPASVREGGTDAFFGRLRDPAELPRIRQAVEEKIEMMGDWDTIQIATVEGDAPKEAAGQRLGSYAGRLGRDPYDVTIELLTQSRNRVQIVGHGMGEEDVERFVAHSLGAYCSDAGARRTTGPFSEGVPHPRAYGAFPRIFGKYVREERALSLEEAVRKASALPAEILRLTDRGTIERGKAADLVVFDPESVADTATFEAPHSYPVGLPHVVVNGTLAIHDGEPTGELPGRVLRIS